MQTLLLAKNLWKYVVESTSEEDLEEWSEENRLSYQTNACNACSILMEGIGDDNMHIIRSCVIGRPEQIWERLEKEFDSTESLSYVVLRMETLTRKFRGKDPIALSKFIDEFCVVYDKLERLGHETSGEEKTMNLVNSLSENSDLRDIVRILQATAKTKKYEEFLQLK